MWAAMLAADRTEAMEMPYVERMQSVVGTARLREVKVLEYLVAVIRADHAGQTAPDLPLTSPP